MLHDLSGYYVDRPIDLPDHDAFGRHEFVTNVATTVNAMGVRHESSIAALVGPWGSGKSSIFNLLERRLNQATPEWIVRRFNPWLFSDIDSLLVNFFAEISRALPAGRGTRATRKRIGQLAKQLSPLGKIGSLFGWDASEPIASIGSIIQGDDESAAERHETLREELNKLPVRICFVLDDFDRLQPDELLVALKLIRLIGNLPNIHYILAYDERTLLDLLISTPVGSGNEARAAQYIDKMVQIRFDIPPLTDHQLDKTFEAALIKTLTERNCSISEAEFRRLGQTLSAHMIESLRVPRHIIKYFAQFNSALTADYAEEINLVDFAILTYIRTFRGTLYARLPYWKKLLLGHAKTAIPGQRTRGDVDAEKLAWTKRLDEAKIATSEHDRCLDLLSHLFPALSEFSNDRYISRIDQDRLARNKHVASTEYFDRYFQGSIPDDDIADKLLVEFLRQVDTAPTNATPVDELAEKLAQDPVLTLRKLRDLLPSVQLSDARGILTFIDEHYEGWLTGKVRASWVSPSDQSRYLAADALHQTTGEARRRALEHLALDLSLRLALDVAVTVIRSSGDIEDWTQSLASIVSERFVELAESEWDDLDSVSDREFLLFTTWGQIDHVGTAREFARTRIEDGRWSLDSYLARLPGTSIQIGVSNPRPRLADVDAEWIERFIGVDYAVSRLGNRLDEVPPVAQAREIYFPTAPERLEYILGLLRVLRDDAEKLRQEPTT